MFRRLQWDIHSRHRADLASPHPGAVDHILGCDRLSVRGGHAHSVTIPLLDGANFNALKDTHAHIPRTLRQRHGRIHGIGASIIREIKPGADPAWVCEGPQIFELSRRDFLHFDAHRAGEGGILAQHPQPGGGTRGLDIADRFEAGGDAGFLFEVAIEFAGVMCQFEHGLGGKPAADDKPCRMPGCAGGQLFAFEDDDILPPKLCQMIRCTTSNHPAADDDHPCM